ncbi:TPA: phage tail protein, partial [Enterobacter roggenkampii]|nr:phage tail protein [Enterobacter roggenkampii]
NINNTYFGVYRVWTTKNTTVDGSGFIKRASPIARLVADTSIMSGEFTDSFKISGSGAVNEEAEGVDIEKLGDGRYRISGSDGLAQDGWQIEVPKDINGNRLCFVEVTEGLEGILLKVFKPKLDLETGGIIAGESFDIPEGRWIDVRLQMPASSAYNVVQGKIAGQLESQQMA